MTVLYWREPLWLLLAVLPLLMLWLRARKRQRQAAHYAEPALQPWVLLQTRESMLARLFSKDSAFVAAWLLLSVAAAGPRLPLETSETTETSNADVMLVVDISRSMSVADVSPNRLRRAQIELEELLDRAQGLRFGIIVYAARAHLYVPLTSDRDALRFYLASLDALIAPTQGSQPAEALALAQLELRNSPGKSAIVWVTDGDFASTQPVQHAVDDLARVHLPLYILGIGSVEGDAIPLATGGWLTDNGHSVISQMNESALRNLAQAGGGAYSPVRDDDSDWSVLYDAGIARHFAAPPQNPDDAHRVWRELYTWPLLPGIALLWFSLLPFRLGFQHSFQKSFRQRFRHASKRAPAVLILPLAAASLFFAPPPTQAAETEQAYAHYAQGDYAAALKDYKKLSGYGARFGEGVSRYQLQDYAGAVRQFQQAALAADNDAERGAALFDLGNSYFKFGDYAAAVAVYRDALLYRPTHAASQHNLAFSQALQQAVEERLQGSGSTSRAGSGPQRAIPIEALNVTDSASLALDDSETKPKTTPLPERPAAADGQWEKLIARGLAHVKLAAQSARQEASAGRRPADVARAQQQMEALQDTQALLWKRLFEMEEGFAAPLDAPREMPGVAPW